MYEEIFSKTRSPQISICFKSSFFWNGAYHVLKKALHCNVGGWVFWGGFCHNFSTIYINTAHWDNHLHS